MSERLFRPQVFFEATDPTAGATAGSSGAPDNGGQEGASPSSQPTPASQAPSSTKSRLFTQDEVNQIVQERMARAQRRFEQQIQMLQKEYEQALGRFNQSTGAEFDQYQNRTVNWPDGGGYNYPQPAPSDGWVQSQALEQRLARLEEVLEDQAVEREIDRLQRAYNLTDDQVNEVLELALDYGIADLQVAFQLWDRDRLRQMALTPEQIEELKKKAVEEYLAQKQQQRESTPRPESAGGAAPSPSRKIKSFDDARKSAMERLKNVEI